MLFPSVQSVLSADRLGKFFAAVAISLSWLFLHPLARDEVNLNAVALVLALSLVTTIATFGQFIALNRAVAISLTGLGLVAVVSTIVSGGRLNALRDVVLIVVTVSLGLSLSALSDRRTVLWGLTGGAILVALVGWTLSIRRNGLWTGFDYDFVGVTDNGGPEHFSALVGLVGALTLVARRGIQLYAATVAAVFLGFTLLVTGPSIGIITLTTTVVGAGFVRVLRSVAPHLRKVMVAFAASIAALGLALVANRGLATRLATAIDEYESVDARYVIWESAINAISPWGWIFGHGTYFWNQDSPRRSEAVELMVLAGYPGFSHAHSSYLDLFLAFGIVGSILLAVLVSIAVALSLKSWRVAERWTEYSLPLLVAFSLGVQAISQSNLVSRPAGWLLCGMLVGLLASSREGDTLSTKFWWAPSGSNRRPTD